MTAESLIFDIDGTLWDVRKLVGDAYTDCLDRQNVPHVPITVPLLTTLFGKVNEEFADALMPEVPVPRKYDLILQCIANEMEFIRQRPCTYGYPEIQAVLEALSRRHRLFIVSNSEQGYPQLCAEKLGIRHLITASLCYGDTGTPKGETIRRLMAENKIESAVYIGDTQGDLDATLDAGLPFIWAAYGFGHPEKWDEKIDTPSDLTRLF